ncbi:hypothetical protein NEOLEDRAFT_522922 [Neolentinus lepideus HHB14362 ss-1]|uniref:Uncharacterized protein n=1 Tax=Neolentinus lepideus HHB14362 ss-1 TaxID=1314782 RepID=A0A165RCL9_9AGAM|nr:hypothetical protein NEOLEDRAFT_522922 [Neolentinus lepideus HHB14362 ss-1]
MALAAAYSMLPDRRLSLLHHPSPTYLPHGHSHLNPASAATSPSPNSHLSSRASPLAFPTNNTQSFASQWNASMDIDRVPASSSYGQTQLATNPTPASLSSYLNSNAPLSTWTNQGSHTQYSAPGPDADSPSTSLNSIAGVTLPSSAPNSNSAPTAPGPYTAAAQQGGGCSSSGDASHFGDYPHDRLSLASSASNYTRALHHGANNSSEPLHQQHQQVSLTSMPFRLTESSQRTILGHSAGLHGPSPGLSAAVPPYPPASFASSSTSHSPSPPVASSSKSPYAFPPLSSPGSYAPTSRHTATPPYHTRSAARSHSYGHTAYNLPPSPLPALRPSTPPVKKEPQDGFIIEPFSHAQPGSSTASAAATKDEPKFLDPPVSIYALNNTASSVPLRATQASKEMRKMMGVFRRHHSSCRHLT